MSAHERTWIKSALRIHEVYARPPDADNVLSLPHVAWNTAEHSYTRLDQARRRNWPAAERRIEDRLSHELALLTGQIQCVRTEILRRERRFHPPMVRSILEELRALRDEFSAITIDLRESRLTVTTPDITLEEVELGPFAIAFDWRKLWESSPYRMTALEPNPAASNDEVVHPHVSDGHLCEGNASHAIRMALDQGRLLDFFLLIRQVLMTYNADSPYVPLERWSGVICTDCGYLADEDSHHCDQCRTGLCSECATPCGDCGETHCSSCLEKCAACSNLTCTRCLHPCETCHDNFCSECLHDQSTCSSCLEAEAEEKTPSLHPDRLGETSLPARPGGL